LSARHVEVLADAWLVGFFAFLFAGFSVRVAVLVLGAVAVGVAVGIGLGGWVHRALFRRHVDLARRADIRAKRRLGKLNRV
jgi:hypothetical protein